MLSNFHLIQKYLFSYIKSYMLRNKLLTRFKFKIIEKIILTKIKTLYYYDTVVYNTMLVK